MPGPEGIKNNLCQSDKGCFLVGEAGLEPARPQ